MGTHVGGAWTEPGAHVVAPNVWRIPVVLPLDGLKAVNVYAIVDGGGLTLVDGGWALDAARRALVDGLAVIGAELGDINQFLVTHVHRDHYTNAIAVRRELGTKVLLGAGEQRAIERITQAAPGGPRTHLASLARHGAAQVADALAALGSAGDDGRLDFEAPDAWISSGDRFEVGDRVLEAIATPGHTRGHVVFADRDNGLLFAGDHVLPHITPSIGFEIAPPRLALRDYLDSLRLVRAMPDMTLLPAHGPAGGRVHARVDELLAHHDRRLAETAAAIGAGSTAYDVATQIGWTSRRRKFADLDPFNQMLAVFETVWHLELLVLQGKAATTEIDGVVVYTAPADVAAHP
ncbi:MAG TPA: MBL fold metallo-hydrolase [Micromonosporaceae bacterium]|nr:MBL fold metallo-hydrolase [Micromonosporaceae bacterium]